MKTFTVTCTIVLVLAGSAHSQTEPLFPEPNQVEHQQPSLDTAISRFEGILAESSVGEIQSLTTNDDYNRQRAAELQRQLAEKQQYLASIPGLVSRQFETLMRQFPDADQATRNRMANELEAQWQDQEQRVHREIAELEAQLTTSTGRISEAAVRRQMLAISSSMADSENALRPRPAEATKNPDAPSDAYRRFTELSQRRLLAKIQSFCPIEVKPLVSQLSLEYLDD